MIKRVTSILMLTGIALSGCRTSPPIPTPKPPPYTIQPGDTLRIDVFGEPDISREFTVGPTGNITHPLLGKTRAAGYTVQELASILTRLLENGYLVNPKVSVAVVRSSAPPVMIFGEVEHPGAYPIPPGGHLTLLQVIAQAGGFTDIAARDRVRIVRTENGKETKLRVRTSELLDGTSGKTDIVLKPGDVITVPETIF